MMLDKDGIGMEDGFRPCPHIIYTLRVVVMVVATSKRNVGATIVQCGWVVALRVEHGLSRKKEEKVLFVIGCP